jgi:hypothetical protein
MMDQHQRLSQPVGWTRAGKVAVTVLVVSFAAVVVALGAYAAAGGFDHKLRAGCIEVTFASTTGGAQIERCGVRARETCASASEARLIGGGLQAACRSAGYQYRGT